MTPEDRPRFLKMMNRLGAAHRTPLTPLLLETYWEALEDLDLEEIEAAAKQTTRECEFFPKAAELRKLATPRGYQPGDGQITPMPDFRPYRERIAEERERLAGPVPIGEVVGKVLPAGEGIIAWRFDSKPHEPEPMTAEQQEARKVALREQLEMLKREGKA